MRRLVAISFLLVMGLCIVSVSASALLLKRARGGARSSYSDLCSQTNVTCVYAWSVVHRLNSTNRTPFTLTRKSDGATYYARYVRTSYYVDVSAEETFCLDNGGTTTVTATYTTYNDCTISQVNDQVASCNLTSLETNKLFPFRVTAADGYPVLLSTTRSNGNVGATQPWLTAYSCSAVAGNAAKSLITYSNNSRPSKCCGNVGLMENGSGPNPTRPITIVDGSMFAQSWYSGGSVPSGRASFCADFEGGGSNCISGLSNTPPIAGVGINTYSGGTNKYNEFFNNVQGTANQTPDKTINTQCRVNIGCDGDLAGCGPVYSRDVIITSNDVSVTVGLPTTIYNYLTNIYAGIHHLRALRPGRSSF
jgi:hypothetical protein